MTTGHRLPTHQELRVSLMLGHEIFRPDGHANELTQAKFTASSASALPRGALPAKPIIVGTSAACARIA